ncbi:MAG TPA: hypothetical protein VFM01_18770 [Nakamurella sp.]|jgi:hypothetical protein|nr:hypothetical protein [Nakamurella sp.]
MSRVTPFGSSIAADPSPALAPWVPATRVGTGPLQMLRGARVFASMAAILIATRRRGD